MNTFQEKIELTDAELDTYNKFYGKQLTEKLINIDEYFYSQDEKHGYKEYLVNKRILSYLTGKTFDYDEWPKENPTTLNNHPVKQNYSPNMSEVVKLTKQVESIKNSFKVINHEVDDSIFVKFEFLKNTVYARINKIDWQNNKNPELVKKYQAVVDSYVGKLDDEYLNIKKKFDDIVDNDVKHEIDNVNLID